MSLPQPDARPIGPRRYRLQEDYVYEWVYRSRSYRLTVPAGFEYDGNSVPWFVWSIFRILPDGLNRAAGTVHDWLYAHVGDIPNGSFEVWSNGRFWSYTGRWSRKASDRMYGRLLREAGVSKTRRRLAYLGVRFGGSWPWYKRLVMNYFGSVRDFS